MLYRILLALLFAIPSAGSIIAAEAPSGNPADFKVKTCLHSVSYAGVWRGQAVLDVVQQNPDGLSRGEILSQLGVKGNKSAEQSVSNALSALKKSAKVNSREGKYLPASTL